MDQEPPTTLEDALKALEAERQKTKTAAGAFDFQLTFLDCVCVTELTASSTCRNGPDAS